MLFPYSIYETDWIYVEKKLEDEILQQIPTYY